ncbi:lebercilin-like protein [Ambystoma mexicanum]|uniref:lebercilin-like protein n=1 Tax=Ambystoma mexicanum TaxID=8296 RepID=UPI0037E78CDC
MSNAVDTGIPVDESFLSTEAQGGINLAQHTGRIDSVDSQRTSVSKRGSLNSCSTARKHRSNGTHESSSSSNRSESTSSASQDSDNSVNEDLAESPRRASSPELTTIAKQTKKNGYCPYQTKGSTRYPWKKSQPWKNSLLKSHSLKRPRINYEKDVVVQRILSARLHRIKELKNEVYEQQRTLEAVQIENTILKRLQLRHIKALGKFECTENELHQLITRHHSEVRALRGLLRKSQEQERNVSRKLKDADGELLRTKDNLHKLQKLSEDKDLEEREELSMKVVALTGRLEDEEKRIQALEKQLKLNTAFFTRQLAVENRKNVDARETTKKLQLDISMLHQKLKEKERELDIRNIYANRMPKGLQKYDSSPHQKGENLNKAIQTESRIFILAEDASQDLEDGALLAEEEKEKLSPDACKKIRDDSQWSHEDLLKEETRLLEEHYECMERQRKRKEEQEREAEMLRQELGRLENETESLKVEAPQGENSFEGMDDTNTDNQTSGAESYTKMQTKNITVRLRRHYKFTEATENLHQGFPATGPISSSINKNPLKYQSEEADSELENSCSRYEPSFGKIFNSAIPKQKATEGKDGKKGTTTLRDKKDSLMEELFGPGYSFKSSFSNPRLGCVDEGKPPFETANQYVCQTSARTQKFPYENRNLMQVGAIRKSSSWEEKNSQTF